jgi:hypothetical protein
LKTVAASTRIVEVRLRISDGSRELERLNFEVRLEEFIFKSASRLSVTILDPPIATLVANFQSRVLIPTRHYRLGAIACTGRPRQTVLRRFRCPPARPT